MEENANLSSPPFLRTASLATTTRGGPKQQQSVRQSLPPLKQQPPVQQHEEEQEEQQKEERVTPSSPRVIVIETIAAAVEDKKVTCCGCLTISPMAPTALVGLSTVLAFGSGFFGSSYMSFGAGVISVVALVLQRRASMLAALHGGTAGNHPV